MVGEFATASAADVGEAVRAAREAAPAWASTPWQERAAILDRAADLISERRSELAALMAIEVGKTRLEALGDVEESADLIRYYTHQLGEANGFVAPMQRLSPNEETIDVMRPYGVWAVISPFNFPMALVAGPVGAALAAGNTVVSKPSEIGALCGLKVLELFHEAGVPAGALSVLTGPGEIVGAALVDHDGVDGVTFTGSVEVGMGIYRAFASAYPKPVVCEMGGKNPVVVSASADLDAAVEGTARSAYGLAGQKCSAASRAFVDERVADEFVELLAERAGTLVVGDPTRKEPFVGPVIDAAAVERFERAVAEAREARRGARGRRPRHAGRARPRLLPRADRGLGPGRLVALDDGALLPADRGAPRCRARRGDRARERDAVRAHRRVLRSRRGRDRALPRPGRGGRRLRQPAGGRDDGRLARRAAVRRLEGERHERQGRRRPVLPPAVPARAEPDDRRMTSARARVAVERDYAGEADLRLVQGLAAECWRLEGPYVYMTIGDAAWQMYQHLNKLDRVRIRLWLDADGAAVAWAWLWLPNTLVLLTHPQRPRAARRDRARLVRGGR